MTTVLCTCWVNHLYSSSCESSLSPSLWAPSLHCVISVVISSPSNNPGTSPFASNVFMRSRKLESKTFDSSIMKQIRSPYTQSTTSLYTDFRILLPLKYSRFSVVFTKMKTLPTLHNKNNNNILRVAVDLRYKIYITLVKNCGSRIVSVWTFTPEKKLVNEHRIIRFTQ